jgi:hypothetical protein
MIFSGDREDTRDSIQLRALIDGIPVRSSCSYALNYLVEQRISAPVSTSFVSSLSQGKHLVVSEIPNELTVTTFREPHNFNAMEKDGR